MCTVQGLIHALSCVRENDFTPPAMVKCLLDLLEFNDNSKNEARSAARRSPSSA
jgi:hypothetical protein